MTDNNDEYTQWPLPDLDSDESDKNIEDSETSLFGKPASWYQGVKKKPEIQEEEPKPLTLDDIESIRQLAYEDGFKEGIEAGTEQGLVEGK
ncbi:polar flagellar assembly protein, FliH, partial [Psychromonas sp. PRT-SC03]